MKKILFVLLSAGLSFAACNSDGDNGPENMDPTYNEGESFSLNFSESATCTCNGPEVTFNQVVSDSRCPTSVICVWAGEVTIELDVDESSVQLTLNPADTDSSADTLGQWIYQLLEVNPYPGDPEPIPAEDYELVMTVSAL